MVESGNSQNEVCKLTKDLYELKQASQKLTYKFGYFHERIGFSCSTENLCLYVRPCEGPGPIITALFIDILLSKKTMTTVEPIVLRIAIKLELKELSETQIFL